MENTQSRNLRITALRRCAVGNPWLAKSATLMLADIQVKLVTDETFGIKTASTSIAYMGRDYPYKYKRLEPTPAGPLLVLAVDASDAPYDVLEFYTDMVIKSPPGKEAEQVADPRED